MNIFLKSKWSLTILLSTIFLIGSVDTQTQRSKPPLLAHGIIFQNSCNDDQRKLLKSTILKGGVTAPTEAWKIVNTFLCLTLTDKNIISALNFTEKTIKQKYEETGSEPRTEIKQINRETIKSLMSGGDVWDAEIHSTVDTLEILYLKNETCIEGLTFRFHKEQWYLSESSAACD